MELPVAVHLSLSLSPVATVSPDSCFPQGHHSNTWGRMEKLGSEGEGEGEEYGFSGWICNTVLILKCHEGPLERVCLILHWKERQEILKRASGEADRKNVLDQASLC